MSMRWWAVYRGCQYLESVRAVIPAGYIVSSVERPTVTTVGASTLLIADVRVSTYYTRTV